MARRLGSIDLVQVFKLDTLKRSPKVVVQSAVVCSEVFGPKSAPKLSQGSSSRSSQQVKREYHNAYLECLGFDGKTRWRTEIVKTDIPPTTSRLPNDQIAMSTADSTLTIFSLQDGKLLSTMKVPGWQGDAYAGPLPTDDGGYITYGTDLSSPDDYHDYIAKLMPDGTQAWNLKFREYTMHDAPSLSEDGIMLFGNFESLTMIDTANGKQRWNNDYGLLQCALGVNYDDHFVAFGRNSDSGPLDLLIQDSTGRTIKSIGIPKTTLRDDHRLLIFQDNSMLTGFANGFSLINPDGSTRWTINSGDLGYPTERDFTYWIFRPKPDGGIVAYAVDSTDGFSNQNHVIFGLAP